MPDDKLSKRKPRPAPERPTIWAEGSQKPKLTLAAFAGASLYLARRDIGSLVARAATGTAAFAATVAAGRVRLPEDRLGRAGRLIPSHRRVALWIVASARILDEAGRTAHPETLAPATRFARTEPPTPEGRSSRPDAPMQVTLPEPDTTADDSATGAASRSVLGPDPAAAPVVLPEPGPEPGTDSAPPADPSLLAATLTRLAGTALGWGLTLLALPYGVLRATLAHLDGQDLRRIRDTD